MGDEPTLADRLRDECEKHQHDDYCYCGLFMEAAVTVESQADRISELEAENERQYHRGWTNGWAAHWRGRHR